MVYIRFHLPVLLPSYSICTNNINSNLIRLCSICLLFLPQIISLSSSSKTEDRALNIVKSIDEYICETHVFTCFFRQRYHKSFDYQQQQQQPDNCKPLLILHSCLHHDTNTIQRCNRTKLTQTKIKLDQETPEHCFTSSVYKTFYAQHLYSIAPSRSIIKCQIFVIFSLLISFVIKIRACC